MTRGFDELIEHLLAEVGLCGSEGASVADFKSFVYAFYAHDSVTVDLSLLKKVWHWLSSHSEISVDGDVSDPELRFLEAEPSAAVALEDGADPQVRQEVNPDAVEPEAAIGEAHDQHAGLDDVRSSDGQSPFSHEKRGIRIRTSEERIWLALTGHEVNKKKLPPMEFELLLAIARHREAGISQPALVRLTGQDKRSVPKRTNTLADRGYILKETLAGYGTRTSLLIHKRYKRRQEESSTSAVFVNGDLILSRLWDFYFGVFERQNVVAHQDLRRMLGVESKRYLTRKLWRAEQHLMKLGLIEIIKAPCQVDGKELRTILKCVRLLRAPTPTDRNAFLLYKKQEEIGLAREVVDDSDDDDESENDDEEVDDHESANLQLTSTQIDQEMAQDDPDDPIETVAQWNGVQPVHNLLFDLVDAAGQEGLNSSQLARRSLGSAWTRPLEETIGRLTDTWETSQPQHLRHLSIIRDTKSFGIRGTQYVYRSLAGHQAAVTGGEASWEGISKTAAGVAGAVLKASDIDRWGFPKPRASDFVNPLGHTSPSQCFEAANVSVENMASEPAIGTNAQGKEYVYWPKDDSSPRDNKGTGAPTAKRQERRGRKSGGMFEGVQTTSAEYQKLWREKKKEEKLDNAWRARAEDLARWRALQELRPNGLSASTENLEAIETTELLGSRRSRKRKRAGTSQGKEDMSDAAPNLAGNLISADHSNAGSTSARNGDVDVARKKALDERTAVHLEQILSRQAPGAYYEPPGCHRKNLPPYTQFAVVVIKSDRLREFSWFEDLAETDADQSEAEDLQCGLTEDIHVDNASVQELAISEKAASPRPATNSITSHPMVGDDMRTELPGPSKAPAVLHSTTRHGERRASHEIPRSASEAQNTHYSPQPVLATALASSSHQPVCGSEQQLPETRNGSFHSGLQETPNADDAYESSHTVAPSELVNRATGSMNTVNETSALDDLPGDDNDSHHIAERQHNGGHLSGSPESKATKRKSRPKQGVLLGGGSVARIRTSILQDMLERCGGLIPGGSDLVQPFVVAFQARVPDAPTPDRETVNRAVKNIRDQGSIKYFDFPLTGRNGKRTEKRIIALTSFSSKSPELKELMRKMQAAHPNPYVPAEMWEPGTAEQARSRPTASRILQSDFSATVPILHPSTGQNNQILKAAAKEAERKERRREKDEARAVRKAEQEARAADRAAEKEARAVERAAVQAERARRAEEKERRSMRADVDDGRRRRRSTKRRSTGLVDYQTPDLPPMLFSQYSVSPLHNAFEPERTVSWQHAEQQEASRVPKDWSPIPQTQSDDDVRDQSMSSAPSPDRDGEQDDIRRRLRDESDDENESTTTPGRPTKRRRTSYTDPEPALQSGTPIRSSSEMSYDQLLRLLHAHVAAKVLVCGLDGAVNWNIVDHVFRYDGTYNKNVFKSKFNTLMKSRPNVIESMMNDFQISYLTAYEAGEVPTIDYGRVEQTDWDAIVQWSMRSLPLGTGALPELPQQQSKLERTYVVEQDKTYFGRDRSRFSKENISELQRNELLHDLPFQLLHPSSEDAVVGLSLKQKDEEVLQRLGQLEQPEAASQVLHTLQSLLSTDRTMVLMVAKSIVRANAFTPAGDYDSAGAQRILSSVPAQLLLEATNELESSRVITKKARDATRLRPPNRDRPYTIDDYFSNALPGYCYIQPADLDAAVAFKLKLDRAFRSDEPHFSFGFDANDGMNLAATNLAAKRKIEMIATLPPFDDTIGAPTPTISKWGWNAGEYKGAKTDLMSMEMVKLDMIPTESYEFGVPAGLGKDGSLPTAPPRPGADDKIRLYPLWVDIHGNLMMDWWRKLVCYIIQTIHLRPYIDADQLTEIFRGLIWRWEVELILEWAEVNGLIIFPASSQGDSGVAEPTWLAADYWWFCLANGDDFSDIRR